MDSKGQSADSASSGVPPVSNGISRGRSITPVNLLLRPRVGSGGGGGGGGGSVRPVTVSRDRSRSIAISRTREMIARCSIATRWRNNNVDMAREKERRRGEREKKDSLDQDPPEAAEAGAIWHFARVRYSHFLPDQVYTVPVAFLSSSFVLLRHSVFLCRSI